VDVARALRVRRTLTKPFKLTELLTVIPEVLEEGKLRTPATD